MERFARQMSGKPAADGEDDDDDFGLNYPLWYALQTWHDYTERNLLPESGGINDQDPRWYEDMQTLNRRYAAAMSRIREDDSKDSERDIFKAIRRDKRAIHNYDPFA